MGRRVVLSDLHVDTWTDRKLGQESKTKKDYLFELLDWCQSAGICELIINGDLMDFPPFAGQPIFPHGPSVARDVIERLVHFAEKTTVTYIFGNHDVGISGFRTTGVDSIPSMRDANFAYPGYIIDDYPVTTIRIEHGHLYDPVLLLYVRDFSRYTFDMDTFEKFQWALQRRKADKPHERTPPGALPAPRLMPGVGAYLTSRQGQKPLAVTPTLWSLWRSLKRIAKRPAGLVTMEWWWQAAIDQMRAHVAEAEKEGRDVKPVLYQVYGHTHRADFRDPITIEGRVSGVYINAGTWTEGVDQGWYLDIDDTGKVWIQDWINEPPEMRRL